MFLLYKYNTIFRELNTLKTMKKIFLLSSDHLEDGLWFRDEEDFKVAMNYVAIQAALHPEVIVLAFILMSNHVHFVLRGRREDIIDFLTRFKQRYALYYYKKYGDRELLRRNGLDVKPIPAGDEAIERTVAYVQMNCVAANQIARVCGLTYAEAARLLEAV